MPPGSAVTWVERRRDGTTAAGVKTYTASPVEFVRRSDGTTVECVCLQCHRFVPVADLVAGHHDAPLLAKATQTERPGHSRSLSRRVEISSNSDPQLLIDIHEVDERASRPSSDASMEPATSIQSDLPGNSSTEEAKTFGTAVSFNEPCNVLAIDFLNLLVRAYHVGTPTETHAVRSFFQTLAKAIRTTDPAHIVIAMDGGHTYRSTLLPEYKAHRPPSEPGLTEQKTLAEKALQLAGFPTVRIDGWEADDVIASIATQFERTVIVSSDKDLLAMHGQGGCRILHPWGDGGFVTPESRLELPADQVTDFLALCGDSTDGVPGVKGIGPKTAMELLQKYKTLDAILTKAYFRQIPGSVGKRLRDEKPAALLCREVVQLNTALPVHLPEFAAKPGWQQRLTEMKLGTVAAVVESLLGMRFMERGIRVVRTNVPHAVNSTTSHDQSDSLA
ncbi:MAG: 5'-3' exonuclease, partial [Planctomycetaceae bacterium]|nr:5'-3' exonuclease [Planctomycetaceae bacterium]